MQTPKYLLAWHLPILNIILPPFYTLILPYNPFSLYSFIKMQNIFYYSFTFLYLHLLPSQTSHNTPSTIYAIFSHLYTSILGGIVGFASYQGPSL